MEIDNVKPLVIICTLAQYKIRSYEKTDIALRVITEHMRGITFMIADRILPSNEGRGYVLRSFCAGQRHGKLLEMEIPFSTGRAAFKQLMGNAYPEITKNMDYITYY